MIVAWYGVFHLRLYMQRAQGNRFKYNGKWPDPESQYFTFKNQTKDNMFWTLASGLPIWTAYGVVALWMFANGHLSVLKFSRNPVWFVALMLLIPLIREFHFHWVHRMIHWPPLYKWVHSLNHRNTNLGPWSGLMVDAEVLDLLIRAAPQRLAQFGVRRTVVFSGHFADEQLALIAEIARCWATQGSEMTVIARGINMFDGLAIPPDHARVFETTMLYALHPDRVDLDELESLEADPLATDGGDAVDDRDDVRHDPAHRCGACSGPTRAALTPPRRKCSWPQLYGGTRRPATFDRPRGRQVCGGRRSQLACSPRAIARRVTVLPAWRAKW